MSSPPLDLPELTSSDVLSSDAWLGRTEPPSVGLDVACTKIAVDLQNLERTSADEVLRRSLEVLAELTASDCAFVALIDEGRAIGQVHAARRGIALSQPEGLKGVPLAELPWL